MRHAANIILIGTFGLLLLAPTLDKCLHFDHSTGFNEKRSPAPFPELKRTPRSLPEYTRGLEDYFNDHFGCRNQLINWYRSWQMAVFNTGSTKHVVIGKAGWLFYSETGTRADEHFCGALPYSQKELLDFKTLLERRRDWLAKRGCSYIFVVAPDKQSIYPEYLPSWLEPISGRTKLDQLIAYLGKDSTVTVLDLRKPLREAKRTAPTYYKTDTHWNDFGAFVGCEETIKALSRQIPSLKPLTLDSFDMKRESAKGGDLAEMLGVYAEDEKLTLVPHANLPALVKSVTDPGFVRPKYFTSNKNAEGTAVVFRDSFGAAMMPFLGYHFGKVGYFWTAIEFDCGIVEENRPTVVISEIVERHFNVTDLPRKLEAFDAGR